MQHYVYDRRAFGQIVDQTVVLHLSVEEMKQVMSLMTIGAIAPGEMAAEDRTLLGGFEAAINCLHGIVRDGKRRSNTEIADFDVSKEV